MKYSIIMLMLVFAVLLQKFVQAEEYRVTTPDLTLFDVIEVTLESQPEILLAQEAVTQAQGTLQAAQGDFEPILSGGISYEKVDIPYSDWEASNYGYDNNESKNLTYQVGLSKAFHSGIQSSATLSTSKTEDQRGIGSPDITRSSLYFSILKPLGRGSEESVVAEERTSELSLQVADYQLRQTVAENIRATTNAYWDYLAAFQIVEIRKQIEDRAEKLLDDTKLLISADMTPAAEDKQLIANLAGQRSNRIQAELQLYQAKQILGLAMGFNFDRVERLGRPVTRYPELSGDVILAGPRLQNLIDEAMFLRWDMKMAANKEEIANVTFKAAKDQSKNKLDLEVRLGVDSVDEKSFSDFALSSGRTTGPSFSIQLSGELPFGNNRAKGELAEAQANIRQAKLSSLSLTRTVRSQIMLTANELDRNSKALLETIKAVDSYREALLNEEKKFKLGFSTITDVITMEDRLNEARIKEVQERSMLAKTVANLRYESGTLVSVEKYEGGITLDNVMTIPR